MTSTVQINSKLGKQYQPAQGKVRPIGNTVPDRRHPTILPATPGDWRPIANQPCQGAYLARKVRKSLNSAMRAVSVS